MSQCITDTRYNTILFGQGTDDLGIDAVYIKESEDENVNNEILLFNFKYREQYKPDQEQEESALSRCEKFLNYIVDLDEKLETDLSPESKTYLFLNDIRKKLNSLSIWDVKLFIVSNETMPISNQEYINRFQKAHELKVECITLDYAQMHLDTECAIRCPVCRAKLNTSMADFRAQVRVEKRP